MIRVRSVALVAIGAVSAVVLSAPTSSSGASLVEAPSAFSGQGESPLATALSAKLSKKQFKDVKVSVDGGVATLTGSVELYEYKADADKRTHKTKGVTAVRNDIQVSGPIVSDEDLRQKLLEKLQYDRVGYGNAFNAISLGVQNGAVTLGGHARTDVDRDSAVALVSMYPGVKDVNDEIEVDPVSIMDDQIRMAVASTAIRRLTNMR